MIEFGDFYQHIAKSPLSHWLDTLPAQLSAWQRESLHGKFKQWFNSVEHLPTLTPTRLDLLHGVRAEMEPGLSPGQLEGIEKMLRTLMPWRKGPFSLYGIDIDTEWHSDWKWDRVLPHISPLAGRTILDVGCGSGYHLWRMIGAGAHFAVGIDPMQLFLCQFEAVRKLLGGDQRAHLLPLGIEQLPDLAAFDTVFSMGVLYHRRSPLDHLYQLKNQLVAEGELVLETLVVEGDRHQVLVPGDRYAQMRNVYFIPSAEALKCWLEKCGFVDVKIADMCVTSLEEQRRTDWMTSESLAEFLDPNDRSKTVEGYPAPLRAVLTAKNPSTANGLACAGPNSPVTDIDNSQLIDHRRVRRDLRRIAGFTVRQRRRHHHRQRAVIFQVADRLAEQRRIGGERLGHHLPTAIHILNHATVG